MMPRQVAPGSLLPVRGWILSVALVLASALPRSADAQATCPSSSLVTLAPVSPAFVSALHSINSNVATDICFVNMLSSDVDVFWIDFGPDGTSPGAPVFYQLLPGGQSYWQGTYVTHPWLITDAATNSPIVGFLPLAADGEADIRATSAVPEPSELLLLATGLCCVAGVTLRRRRVT